MKNKLMIITRDQEQFSGEIKKLQLNNLEIYTPKNEKEILDNIKDINIFFANPTILNKYINEASNVTWVQSTFAGIDSLVSDKLINKYILTNVKETYGKEISEYIFSYILMLKKDVLNNIEYQKNREWNQKGYPSVKKETIAIMGTGSIGKEIARVAKAFGMKTIGFRTKDSPIKYFDEIYTFDSIKDFFTKADYLISVLPDTQFTKNIVNKETLSYMKKTSIFINVGRGNNVDEEDLFNSLKNKDISFAILDVFKKEPLPKNHIFWDLDNVLITPHVSGYIENVDRIIEIFGNNYNKFINGEELDYIIDFKKGY